MNKKGLIVGILVVLVAGVAIWKVTSNNSSNDVASNVSEKSEASQGQDSNNGEDNKADQKDSDKNDSDKANQSDKDSDNNSTNNSSKNGGNNSNSDNSAIVSKISGFTSENGSSSNSGKDNSSSSNNGNSKSNKKNNNSSSNKSNTMSLPYTIASTGMKVTNIGKYSGKFVENGSDKRVSNVLSIVVTNTSNKDLQYGEIKLKAGGQTATFKLTNIPSEKSVLALEANGMKYSSGVNYKYADATYALTNMPMNSNKVKVSTSNSKVTIKNTSGKNLGTVYVYYKNLDKSGAYLGGITYRVKFDNVKKGETLSQNTKHFSKSHSKIVMVDTEK